jgi:beta-mannanase
VYCGNDPDAVLQFEAWLGRNVDAILGYTGAASWADYDGSVGWAVGLWSQIDRPVYWSVPLIPEGATLEEAAQGSYNHHYLAAAQTLAAFRPQDEKLQIRTAWELNGDWFPWAAQDDAASFVGAFREFVTTFRSASERFVFEWNANVGRNLSGEMDPADAYPGDGYVDIIGMDFYWNTQWDPTDPQEAWSSMRDRTYGLTWHQDFAASHGKPTSYSEWGIMTDAAGPYIEHAASWFESHPVVFHTYWNSNSAFAGMLSDGQYPAAGAAYRAAFGP